MSLNPETLPEVSGISDSGFVQASDCVDLYKSFLDAEPSSQDLLSFASNALDFRKGRAREDTPWSEGESLSISQKEAAINLADHWGMLRSSYPKKSFDSLVVLGAHKDSLRLRMRHAANILMTQKGIKDPSLVLLSCYRPLLPREVYETIETEQDLAINLAESEFKGEFMPESFSCWEDLTYDADQAIGEYAVAAFGHLAGMDTVSISGSVPSGSRRATTASTLMSLETLFETSRSRLLFVTTSLHLPYQRVQIQKILTDFNTEAVGMEMPGLTGINIKSEDYKFRIILQEIGATIKNILSSAHDMEVRPATSV